MVRLLSNGTCDPLQNCFPVPVSSYCVLLPGIIAAHEQNFALTFAELLKVPLCVFLQFVKVPLNGSTHLLS